MSSDRPGTSLERLRETVALRVQATSLRAVARQVGMSPSGLEKFLGGSTPYSTSRQKLQEWWAREGAHPRDDLTAEGMEIAIGALVRDLPAEHRPEAIRRVIESLARVYRSQDASAPAWLAHLASTWGVTNLDSDASTPLASEN